MEESKQNLPNSVLETIEDKEVFSRIAVSKAQNDDGHPKSMQDGVVFIANNIKLMPKDGSYDVLSYIGLPDYEGKTNSTFQCFRPTTFAELITAFQYTSCRGLTYYFRSREENNANMNGLLCSFLQNNLSEDNVDVKELAVTSMTVKGIVDEKAQQFYNEKQNFLRGKIQKYQSKIEALSLERNGKDLLGGTIQNTEQNMHEVLENIIVNGEEVIADQETSEMPVEEMLKYFNQNKIAESSNENSQVGSEALDCPVESSSDDQNLCINN